jgi:hypothetical protein
MAVNSREGLKQYCLRALGAPVLEINVDDDQLEDRIDDALEYWRQYHSDGVEQIYMKQMITASEITLTTSDADLFKTGEMVRGSTSNATAIVTLEGLRTSIDNKLLVYKIIGTFIAGETITGIDSNVTAILAVNPVLKGVYDNQYINVPDLVYGITNILPIGNTYQNSQNLFNNIQYQLRLNSFADLSSLSLIYYTIAMSYLDLVNFELTRIPTIRFNRYQGRLMLDINWETEIFVGQYIVAQCYRALDPTVFNKVWGEIWLKHYTTGLFKRQWGMNLKKFGGMLLPGGVQIDGQAMYDEAIGELKDLEDELMNKSAPLQWFTG